MVTWFRRGGDDHVEHDCRRRTPHLPRTHRTSCSRRLWRARVSSSTETPGKLPVESIVVTAREITDTIREVIATSSTDRELDIYAIVSINGIVDDYLPTTLRAYLNLDPHLTERVGPSGRTPRAALREQLDALATGAADLLEAAQAHDVDALSTQGNFLQTKFSRSDLDLS